MQRLLAKCCKSRSTPSLSRSTMNMRSETLGPEGHFYDELPTPTSIRVLILAPGKIDDDIHCYLYPCDLNKDWAFDRSNPRPFESTCVAFAKTQGENDATKRFVLSMDSYIDESDGEQTNIRPTQHASALPKDNTSVDDSTHSKPANDVENQGRGEEVPQKVQQSALNASDADVVIEEHPQEEQEMGDDWWDLLQLAKLSMADGALDDRVHRHPFQRYTALSYVWGSVNNPAYITIDGSEKFKVTRNLFNALKCLREPDQTISLWVDAICINQNDPEEKKVQIGLMRRVYKQAKKVIAYVPQSPEDVQPFLELAEKIFNAGRQCREAISQKMESDSTTDGDDVSQKEEEQTEDDSTYGPIDSKIRILPLKPTGTCIEDYDVPPEDDAVWFTWRRFFASPYFRRIWILQEFALAKDLYLHNGRSMLAFHTLFLVMNSVSNYSRMLNVHYLGRGENAELSRAAFLGWQGLETMNMERVFAQEELDDEDALASLRKTSTLVNKIRYAFDFDATDPRDKIYALLGLVSDAERYTHLVSYQSADIHSKVYVRFAKAFIEQGHLVTLLHMACRTAFNIQLPSWVPDWSVPTEASRSPGIARNKRYRAGGTGNPSSASFVQNQLTVSGQLVAKVAFMTSPAQKYSSNADLGGRIQDIFEMLMTALNELQGFLKQNPKETLQSFFCCITTQLKTFDSFRPGDEESSEFIRDFGLWRILFARISEYHKIENHGDHKVTFGAFPEEDLAFIQRVAGNLASRCFCVTSPGNRVGLVPERAEVGDSIAVLKGAPVPFILREAKGSDVTSGPVHNLVGDAFVLNMMQGELVHDRDDKWRDIMLV